MTEIKLYASALRIFFTVLLLVAGILVFMSLSMTDSDVEKSLKSVNFENMELAGMIKDRPLHKIEKTNMDKSEFWQNVNLKEPHSIPLFIQDKVERVKLESLRVSIMGIDLFYREATLPMNTDSSGQSVLLLHGAAFKSKTWLDLGTLSIIAAMGHRVIAIDLPGYGETKSTGSIDNAAFLKNVISTLQMNNVVIVSPSMSGSFSIPFLMKYPDEIIGFIPVAPVQTELLRNVASGIVTPTLIIYGELDRGLGHSSLENLRNLPNNQVIELPNAKHPAYLDQPQLFHTLIYNFLDKLKNCT